LIFIKKNIKKKLKILLKFKNNTTESETNNFLCFYYNVGDKGVVYLFTRVKFNWNELQFSVFSTTAMCVNLLGKWNILLQNTIYYLYNVFRSTWSAWSLCYYTVTDLLVLLCRNIFCPRSRYQKIWHWRRIDRCRGYYWEISISVRLRFCYDWNRFLFG
jgi:hypothetical protein